MNNNLTAGTILNGNRRYKIERILGKGGFGVTYYAKGKMKDGRIVQETQYTIKEFFIDQYCRRMPDGTVTAKEGFEDVVAEHKKAFRMEAKRLIKLDEHEGIVKVNEIFEANNTVYYVMQYLGDVNVEKYVCAHDAGRLSETEAIGIFIKIAKVLDFLHCHNITHLDVKPANIMLLDNEIDEEKCPVLIDFGLAVHYSRKGNPTTEHKAICCSDGYSPQEQYLPDSSFTPETDIYALGATLLFMLSGNKPPMAAKMDEHYIDSSLCDLASKNTISVLKKCMAPLVSSRFHSCADILAAIQEQYVRNNEKPEATPEEDSNTQIISGGSWCHKPDTAKQRSYVLLAQKVLLLILLIAVFVLSVILFGRKAKNFMHVPEEDTIAVINDTATPKAEKLKDEQKQNEKQEISEYSIPEPPPVPDPGPDDYESEPQKKTISIGDYATYNGYVNKEGLPDGHGALYFHKTHFIDSYDKTKVADSADVVEGLFRNGHIHSATWTKASGEKPEKVTPGS